MEPVYILPLIAVLASLLCAYVSFRYLIYYRGLISTGGGNQDKNRHVLKNAQVSLLVSSLAFTGMLLVLFNLAGKPQPPTASTTLTPGAVQLSPTAHTLSLPAPIPSPEISPTTEAVAGVGFARIGNTNNFGANVRSEPGLRYEMLAQLSDGSRVELTGEAQKADGFTWQRIRLEDGRLGWIADNFIIPEP